MEDHYFARRLPYEDHTNIRPHLCQSENVMTPEEARRTQKPYRYGMILLCFGALINWIGLAENYTEPIRYAGVACIIGGALLICTAMCCWLHTPNRSSVGVSDTDDPIHVITVGGSQTRTEKPPEYDAVVIEPPSYDDAIKLDPAILLTLPEYKMAIPTESIAGSSQPIEQTPPYTGTIDVVIVSFEQPNGSGSGGLVGSPGTAVEPAPTEDLNKQVVVR